MTDQQPTRIQQIRKSPKSLFWIFVLLGCSALSVVHISMLFVWGRPVYLGEVAVGSIAVVLFSLIAMAVVADLEVDAHA